MIKTKNGRLLLESMDITCSMTNVDELNCYLDILRDDLMDVLAMDFCCSETLKNSARIMEDISMILTHLSVVDPETKFVTVDNVFGMSPRPGRSHVSLYDLFKAAILRRSLRR